MEKQDSLNLGLGTFPTSVENSSSRFFPDLLLSGDPQLF